MLGQLLAGRGDFDTAISYLQESIAILQHIGSPIAEQAKEILARVILMKIAQSPQGEAVMQALQSGDEDILRALLEQMNNTD